jgi:hypothetical protein
LIRLLYIVTICVNVGIGICVCVSGVVVRVDLHVIGIVTIEMGALRDWGRCQGGVRRCVQVVA